MASVHLLTTAIATSNCPLLAVAVPTLTYTLLLFLRRRRTSRQKRSTESKENTEESKKNVPDSFRVYRAGQQTSGDEESDSGTSLSTCYSVDLSDIDT